MTDASSSLTVLQTAAWQRIPKLVHAFCTRRGGVSLGAYAALNLSSKVGDARSAVEENWSRVRQHSRGRLELVTMNQVHGTTVAAIGPTPDPPGDADAMVTGTSGIGLCVLTADCVPILLVSPTARIVAAVHAGWRGSLGGVVAAALQHMVRQMNVPTGDVLAALGPSIGACCYEVDASIADDLEARWGVMPAAIRRYERDTVPKARVDLRAVNTKLLIDGGMDPEAISRVGGCTACTPGEFYSHRVASRRGATAATGRQLSFIGWVP